MKPTNEQTVTLDDYVNHLRNRWKTSVGKLWRSLIVTALLKEKAWSGNPDLRGIDLQGLDLSDCAMEALILDFALLGGSNLSGACLQRASLIGVSFKGVNATNTDFDFSDAWIATK